MKRLFILVAIATFFLAISCTPISDEHKEKPVVTVSIQPQKFFVESIADTLVKVNVMIPPGASPATFEAGSEQMKQLSQSQLYIAIGHVVFEKSWGERFRKQNPQMKWVDQSANVQLISGTHDHHHDHAHEDDGHHHHQGIDPHIWTSPKGVKKQLPVIYESLVELLPQHKAFLQTRYEALMGHVDSLDGAVEEQVARMGQKKFMIFHPAYTYFARDYGLEQIPIEFEGKEPTPGYLKEIVKTGKEEGIQYVFIQREFPIENAKVVAGELNAEVVVVEPLTYDWFAGMNHLLTQLAN
jgi:zinc transport system substrate-binding protein